MTRKPSLARPTMSTLQVPQILKVEGEASNQAAMECRKALFLTDPDVERENVISAKGKRVPGTCEWITHDESYRAWLNDANTRLLWISGGPGKGKTMMSLYLIEDLERRNADLIFFFCRAQDEKCNTAVAVLRGLIHQIITKRRGLVRHAVPHFDTQERGQQALSSIETLWIILQKLIADAELGTVFCVLDGLDECEESSRKLLLSRIVNLLSTGDSASSGDSIFKLIIISRDLAGLQRCTRIRLDPDNDEKVISDIQVFVSARVNELSRIEGFDDNFREYVQTDLLQRAEGTFLWVGFAMHELSQKNTSTDVLEALKDLPSGLPGIYSRMLLQIPDNKRDLSYAILQWVTLAIRPLQLRELAAAVHLQPISSQITLEQASRDAVAVCGPIVKIQNQKLGLVHQSARDYLLRKEIDSNRLLEAFRVDLRSTHLEMARTCLECIAQSDLQHTLLSSFDLKTNPQHSPLLRYAVVQWPEHAKGCDSLVTELFDPSGLFLQKNSPLRDHWLECYSSQAEKFRDPPSPLLHSACHFEIIPWIKAVLARKSLWPRYLRDRSVNKGDAKGKTALHHAAFSGNEVVVRLLIQHGADLNARDNDGRSVLHQAAWGANETVVQLLHGADIHVRDRWGWTVLHVAAWRGNEAVMRLLVDCGADIHTKDYEGRTVLHVAAWNGNEAAVRLLVDCGADIHARDERGRTVLHQAARRENKVVLQLLIDYGADVHAKDNDGWTVLCIADRKGNEAVMRLLDGCGARQQHEALP